MSEVRRCCYEHEDIDLDGLPVVEQLGNRRMIVCSVCGNKRCPKATRCSLDCTGKPLDVAVYCGANPQLTGGFCYRRTLHPSGRCHQHRDQESAGERSQ